MPAIGPGRPASCQRSAATILLVGTGGRASSRSQGISFTCRVGLPPVRKARNSARMATFTKLDSRFIYPERAGPVPTWRAPRPGWRKARPARCPRQGGRGPSRRGRLAPGLPSGLGLSHRGGGRTLDEGPYFLRDSAPVGGGGQLAEHREQPEVDALEDHVRPRDGDVAGDGAAQVEEAAHDGGGVVAGDGPGSWFADGVVEDGQVLDDRLGAERRAGAQESGVLQAGAERLGVVLDADGAGHLQERPQLGGGEVPDQPEVEEGDPAAALEQVVARVRVAVEGAHVVQAAEDEAVDRLGGQVAFVLGPAGEFGEADSAG